MTPQELVNVHTSPGGFKVFGTDDQGFKDWIALPNFVVLVTTNMTTLLTIPHSVAGGICLIAQPAAGEPRGVYWDSASTDAHDGYSVWKPTSLDSGSAGRWKQWL